MQRARAAMAVTLLAGCGDPANPIDFKGEALDEVSCVIYAGSYQPSAGTRLQLALLWQKPEGGYEPDDVGSDIATSFPATAAVRIFQPPAASLLQTRAGVTGELAVGQLVAFEDGDGDAIRDPSETLVGMSPDMVVVFTETGVGGQPSGSLAEGFHHMMPNGCADLAQPRFRSVSDSCHIDVPSKVLDPFELTCAPEPTGECVGLTAIRQACEANPNDPRCTTCANGIFPAGATPAECDAWYAACVEDFLPQDCGAEMKTCTSGEDPQVEPECSRECTCALIYDQCIKAGNPEDACADKRQACLR